MRTLLLFIFIYVSALGIKANELQALLNHYTTTDGIASNAVSDIVQDKFGYMWIATWNGLSRFDGYDFYNYPTGKNSGLSNFHNRILTLTADANGNIWMRMYDNRIFVLNRHTDIITNAFANIKDGNSMKTNNGIEGKTHRTASTIIASPDGSVYIYIPQKGIYRMKSDGISPTTQLVNIGKRKVYAMAADSNSRIWIATDKGLTSITANDSKLNGKYILSNKTILNIACLTGNIFVGTKEGEIINAKSQHVMFSTCGQPITSLYIDHHHNIWYTTDIQGVSRFDLTHKTSHNYTQTVLIPESDINGATFNENSNLLWIRMNKGGFGYFDYNSNEMNYFHNNPDNSWNLSNTVAAFVAVPEGVIWMSTIRRGLDKLSLLNPCILRRNLTSDVSTYGVNETRAIIYDNTRNKILYGDKAGNILMSASSQTTPTLLCKISGKIYNMTQMSNGDIYIATKGNGIYILPKNSNTTHHLDIKLSSNNVYQTIKDKSGNLWIATYDGGVNMYDGKRSYSYKNIKGYPQGSYQKVRSIALAANGKVWAGTSDGILVMEAKGGKITATPLAMSNDANKQTGNNDIIQLKRAEDGSIWVATNGGGLSHSVGLDKEGKWCFETFDEDNGLPSNEIKSITITKDNVVWFAADQTLCSFDVGKRLFTTFSILDGVSDVSFSENAATTLPNGEILFGTLRGYYVINRSKLSTHSGASLRLALTDFYIDDKRISPRLDDTYDYYIPDSGSVRLPSRSSIFAVKFASLNYQLQHRVHYQYMLEGYDREWHNADNSRMVSFSNVPAGTYTLRIKAFLLESPDKYDERTLTITIPPYFFASTVALWTYFVLILLCVATYFYIKKRNERLREEYKKQMRVLKVGPQEIAFNNNDDYDFLSSIQEWLEHNFDNPSLKIEDMATHSGQSRTSFYNQLKALTGQSPKEFVSEFRMKKAYMYLENSNITIAEIAYKTGFNDPVYFARLFRQRTGMTPKAYRESKAQEKNNAENINNEPKDNDNSNTQQ